jgi:hypothetical protein
MDGQLDTNAAATGSAALVSRPVPAQISARVAVRLLSGLIVFGYGAFMSLWRLPVPAWLGDEITYARAGEEYWHGQFTFNPEHPPLGKDLIGAAEMVFGPRLGAARLPAAGAMLACGVLLWWWLSRQVGPAAGVTAAVLWWSLPGLTTFPEASGLSGPELSLPQRLALLDPLAGALVLAALIVGWWWVRSGRLRAVALCGVLSGAAVATKLPALLPLAVPALVGTLAVLLRRAPETGNPATGGPGWWARLPEPARRAARAAGHGWTWAGATAVTFAAAYAPMGPRQAASSVLAGWRFQRAHSELGHWIVLRGAVHLQPPWWAPAWWQYVSVGAAVAALLGTAAVAAVLLRPGLGGYLTAAWVLPMLTLVPITDLALPTYGLIWRGPLVAGTATGAALAARRLHRRLPAAVAAALIATAAVPIAVLSARTAGHTLRLPRVGYAALPGLAEPGEVQILGHPVLAHRYLAPAHAVRPVIRPPTAGRPAPGTLVLDRAYTLRFGDGGLSAWARRHGYRMVRTGTLEVWLRR